MKDVYKREVKQKDLFTVYFFLEEITDVMEDIWAEYDENWVEDDDFIYYKVTNHLDSLFQIHTQLKMIFNKSYYNNLDKSE